MPINSKSKGARFERELAKALSGKGYPSRRTAQYCGSSGEAADVVGLDGIHIEAKHQERMQLYSWMEQAVRDSAGSGNLPAVFHRQNGKPILVTMLLDDWMELYNAFRASTKA